MGVVALEENRQPKAEVVTVTPQMAAQWLEHNTRNRSLTSTNVEKLAGAIDRGEWIMNGESIKFSQDGRLLDGQHRLAAVVECNTAIQTLVIHGLSQEAQETVDTGKKRTLPDVLTLRGESNANMLAAALNVVHRIQNETMKRAGSAYPTPQQALKLLQSDPAIREGLTWGSRLNSRLRFPGGLGCGLYHLFSSVAAEDAEVFFESLITGESLAEGSPILALRNNLERRAMKKYDRERMEVVAAWTIKAWNAWREGSEIQRLYWTPGGSRPEPFPAIR